MLPFVLLIAAPALIGLALFAIAAAMFISAVKNGADEHGSKSGAGIQVFLGGCAAVVGCGFIMVSLGMVWCAGVSAQTH